MDFCENKGKRSEKRKERNVRVNQITKMSTKGRERNLTKIEFKTGTGSAGGQGKVREIIPSGVRNPRVFFLLTLCSDETGRVSDTKGSNSTNVSKKRFIDIFRDETSRKRKLGVERLRKFITFRLMKEPGHGRERVFRTTSD